MMWYTMWYTKNNNAHANKVVINYPKALKITRNIINRIGSEDPIFAFPDSVLSITDQSQLQQRIPPILILSNMVIK